MAVHGGGNARADLPRRARPSTTPPTASTRPRSCATSTTARPRRLASGRVLREWDARRRRQGDRGRARASTSRPGPTTAASPGPTLRCREGDLLRIRFVNGSEHPHTIHFHGLHPAEMDGVPGVGAGLIEPGESTVYEFDAEPFGLHLYHCHVGAAGRAHRPRPVRHLHRRPEAGPRRRRRAGDGPARLQHDLRRRGQPALRGQRRSRSTTSNEPIEVKRDELVRIYLVNIARVRPDQLVPHPRQLLRLLPDRHLARADRVHRHGRPGPGAARDPASCASRTPGEFMFHAHKTEFAELGWMGFFEVED